MGFCKELAKATGSALIKDMMIFKFQREVTDALIDLGELWKKAQEIRSNVAERDFVIEELGLLCETESNFLSVAQLKHLQTEDTVEISKLEEKAMEKQARATELSLFIEKLESLEC